MNEIQNQKKLYSGEFLKMSKLLTILLVLIISVQAAHQGLIYAYYVLNKEYIAQNLCENKDVPALKCDGKCHLKHVLSINKKDSTPEQPPIPNLEDIKTPLLFFQTVRTIDVDYTTLQVPFSTVATCFSYLFAYKFRATTQIFHPPQL